MNNPKKAIIWLIPFIIFLFSSIVFAKGDILHVKTEDVIKIKQIKDAGSFYESPLFQIVIQGFIQVIGIAMIYWNTKKQTDTSLQILVNTQKHENKKLLMDYVAELVAEINKADIKQLQNLEKGNPMSDKHILLESKILLHIKGGSKNAHELATAILRYQKEKILSKIDVWLQDIILTTKIYINNEN